MRQTSRTDHLRDACDEDVVAVDQRTRLIEAETAIRVAVVRNADVCMTLEHRAAQRVKVRRAAAVIDVHAVRESVDHLHLRAKTAQNLRHCLIGSTIRAVEHNLHAVEAFRARTHHIVDILVEQIVAILHNPDFLARRTCRIVIRLQAAHKRLEFVLHRVRQLVAIPAEELDPVVGKWIVRGGDHNARLHPVLACEIGDRRRRHNTRYECNPACRADARRERRLEHLA